MTGKISSKAPQDEMPMVQLSISEVFGFASCKPDLGQRIMLGVRQHLIEFQ
jgi:hypothetical protein